MPIVIHSIIAKRISELEMSLEAFDALELSAQLEQLVGADTQLSDDERLGCQAEILGLMYCPIRGDDRGPWDSYFGPIFSVQAKDGEMVYVPDARAVGSEVIEYWKTRSEQTPHPMLQAHYADLALEIGRIWNRDHQSETSVELSRSLIQCSIDGHLKVVKTGLSGDECQTWNSLYRALDLSLFIHDSERIEQEKRSAYEHCRDQRASCKSGYWWRLDNMVWNHKGVVLTILERDELIGWLDEALAAYSDINDEKRFDPHQAQMAADRLKRWNEKLGRPEKGIDAIKRAGVAFEVMAANTNALTATAWLQDLSVRYRQAKLMEDAARVDAAIKARSTEAESSLTLHEVKIEISKEEMDQWLDALTKDSLEHALHRIAIHMMISEEKLRQMVEDTAANAPLHAHLPISLMGEGGFARATIGSIKDDMPGRMLNMAATLIGQSAPWLHLALEQTKTRWSLNTDTLFAWLVRSPLFPLNTRGLLREGIEAWFDKDEVKAVHLLVPQAEAALREWLSVLGESPMTPDCHSDGFKVFSMGEVLRSKSFKEKVHPTLIHHLRAFYTEAKGLNLRNQMAHGLARQETLNRGAANWVVHSLIAIRTFAHLDP